MLDRVDSPVLVPFGTDISVFEDLIGCNVYVNPPYHFWATGLQLAFNNDINDITMNYIRDKIKDDYSGIIKHSKYHGFLKKTFAPETADCFDKLYQIELSKKHKDILIYYLTSYMDATCDDDKKFKKLIFDEHFVDTLLSCKVIDEISTVNKSTRISIIDEPINEYKFSTIYDTIPRVMRMYDRNFLGFVEMFTGVKERLISYDKVLRNCVKNNLIHGGELIIKNCPNEWQDDVEKIYKNLNMKYVEKYVWRNPDINVIKITKGITKYW